jgi:4-amino-4-deoxy-L-arabinose transferase-like glycosyltransferase
LGLVFLQGLFLAQQDSPTYDEPNHITSGYSYLKTGDFRMSLAQPPVGRMFLALPLLASKPKLPMGSESWRKADDWTFAREFLFHSGNDADRIVFWARFQALLLWGLLGLVVFIWSRALFGLRAAYFSLLLYVFSSNILAHGRLATTEMPFTCFAFISAFFFWKLLERPSLRHVLLSGTFLGLALSAKYSGLILILSFLVSTVLWRFRLRSARTGAEGKSYTGGLLAPLGEGVGTSSLYSGRNLRRVLSLSVAVLVLGGVIALLSSGASMKPVLDYPAVQAKLEKFGEEGVFVFESERVSGLAQRMASSVPLPRYVVGILFNHFHFKRGHLAYLAGEWKSGGWWYYFPIAFLLKVPLAFLALLAMGVFVRLRSRLPLSSAEIVLVCVPIVSLLWSMGFVRLNIGFRHILFILPFLHVLLGQLVTSSGSREHPGSTPGEEPAELPRDGKPLAPTGRDAHAKPVGLRNLASMLLLVWYCLASVSISPHHLAYFNQLAGGPSGGVNWFVDSNLDWGQDLKRLKTYVDENDVTSLRLLYFGTAEPSYYGIQFEPLTLRDFENLRLPDAGPLPGTDERPEPTPASGGTETSEGSETSRVDVHYANEKWAMSVTSYAALLRHAPWLGKIRGHEDTRIGHSIFIFSPSKLKSVLGS